jgi:integrase
MRIILKNGTGMIDLRYCHEEPDRHGNVRVYFRKRGFRRVRLKAVPGSDAFMAEYRAALEGRATAAQKTGPARAASFGSLAWLCAEYTASHEFRRLDGATQTMRRRHLDFLKPTYGSGPLSLIEPVHVKAMRDSKDGPHAANNVLKTLRVMFQWAVDNNLMRSNPARDVKRIKVASDGHHTWTLDEIRLYRERHPESTMAGLALALLLYLGVRRSDAVKLGRQMESVDGTSLRLIETKGRTKTVKAHELPILPELRRVLDIHRGRMHYLVTQTGRPFRSGNAFGNKFKDWCRQANLNNCSAHGLRKAGATLAADEGASEHQLMALYGWETPAQAAHYTRKANRKKLAEGAAGLIQKSNIGVAPQADLVDPACRTDCK